MLLVGDMVGWHSRKRKKGDTDELYPEIMGFVIL